MYPMLIHERLDLSSLTAWSIFLLCSLVASSPASAQISPDGTVLTNVSESDDVLEITGGAEAGSNLFHSFQEFSVPTGKEAFFNNAANITNIISRVTGGSVSNIDGLIRANGSANLFLLNPNGIIFGSNAALNIDGSFYATTGDSVLFEDNTEFSATNPQTPLLTVSVPLGLQIDSEAGSIINRSINNRSVTNDDSNEIVGLQVQPSKNLMLIGGDINLEEGNLTAPGGRVELGGLSEAGTVKLNENGSLSFPQNVARANVFLDNGAEVYVRAGGGGSIAVNSQNFSLMEESNLLAGIKEGLGSTQSQAGDIDVNATGTVSLADGSQLSNSVREEAKGKGGDVNITTGSLFLNNGSRVSTNTQEKAEGDAGNIAIKARMLSLTNVFTSKKGNTSDTLATLLTAKTSGQGDAGDIVIRVDESVILDGNSRIESVVDETGIGQGGNIDIQARSLKLANGAELFASTFGQGNAGNIRVNTTDSVILSGTAPSILNDTTSDEPLPGGFSSGFLTATESDKQRVAARGQGGNIDVTTQNLSLLDGAVLSARSRTDFSGGDITVNAETLELTGGGQILTTAFSKGDAGDINLNADNINISGSDSTFADRLNSVTEKFDQEQAELAIDPVSPDSGVFANTTSDATGKAGTINIAVRESLETDGGNISTSAAQSSGGAINITAGDIRLNGDSDISTNVRQGSGGGGNIKLTADSIVAFDDSDIFAFASQGTGGNINLDTPAFFGEDYQPSSPNIDPDSLDANNRVDLNASGAVFGIITIPDVSFIQNSLTDLPQNFINTDSLISSSCIARRGRETGSFTVTGNDSLPMRSGVASDSSYPTGTVQTIPSSNNDRSWKKGDPIIEPTGVYRLPNGELVMSRECSQ
jgi:filamentous hemagglutinin family protein